MQLRTTILIVPLRGESTLVFALIVRSASFSASTPGSRPAAVSNAPPIVCRASPSHLKVSLTRFLFLMNSSDVFSNSAFTCGSSVLFYSVTIIRSYFVTMHLSPSYRRVIVISSAPASISSRNARSPAHVGSSRIRLFSIQ